MIANTCCNMAKLQTQKTLLDFITPKQTDLSNIATKKRRLESDPAASSTQVPFTGDQTNNITFNNSTGPTTIVVNSSSTPDPILNESVNAGY